MTDSAARDSARLSWLVANDASFGTSSRFDGEQFIDSRFVRVPCRHLYEWHCYDGANWREALDNAMAASPCESHEELGCSKTRFAPSESDHPVSQALHEAWKRATALEAGLRDLREAMYEDEEEYTIICKRMRAVLRSAELSEALATPLPARPAVNNPNRGEQ